MRTATHCLVLLTSIAAGASASADVMVADVSLRDARLASLDYGVSERLGRAWLELRFVEEGFCRDSDAPCPYEPPIRTTVAALTYAPSTRQVLLRDGPGMPLVCARVVRHSFIARWETVEPTGACGYRVLDVERVVDDGFGGRRETHRQIWFGAAAHPGPGQK